ncbi:hypothetical protein T01_13160 [Trichinella spiralis]|uniref:Uncharacterized protein n=1 Tax=Trichinella spiralis TaxID=6334 RepID=A0A0V1AHZ0_TRISP|nr:hypothetical protein T01_13160 [Trichinella spiralis]
MEILAKFHAHLTQFKCNLKCIIKQISYIIGAAFDAELFTNALVGFVQMLKQKVYNLH